MANMRAMTGDGHYDDREVSVEAKPAGRGKGKKTSGAGKVGNKKTKAEDMPSKASSSKKSKSNSGVAQNVVDPSIGDFSDDEDMESFNKDEEMLHPSGRKMTEDEKRKNFLERNR